MTRQLDRDVLEGMVELVDLAKSKGVAAPTLDARFAARVLFTLVSGLFKRKAVEPNFDPEAEFAMATGVFEALFAGALAPGAEV